MAQDKVIYTIGHSTRSAEDLLALLRAHGVQVLADVRTIPRSTHNPQFNSEAIQKFLEKNGIRYMHLAALGGMRKPLKNSKNTGWDNASFRGYADYMRTKDFRSGLAALTKTARHTSTAIMCAEAVPWRCHRSLIADALSVKGWQVCHIQSKNSAPQHKLTSFLKVEGGHIAYPRPGTLF